MNTVQNDGQILLEEELGEKNLLQRNNSFETIEENMLEETSTIDLIDSKKSSENITPKSIEVQNHSSNGKIFNLLWKRKKEGAQMEHIHGCGIEPQDFFPGFPHFLLAIVVTVILIYLILSTF